ncbi:MAG TPA: hypothetical protein VHB46_12830 [Burkholderiales bacterium]|nr:hypothetical protein [Burkholderiales bacterium]
MPLWNRRLFKSRPVSRIEIRPGFPRWWFTYAMPLLTSLFAVLLVGLALSDWLPQLLGIAAVGPARLRVVSAVVFIVTYGASVLAMKSHFRVQDSEFSE